VAAENIAKYENVWRQPDWRLCQLAAISISVKKILAKTGGGSQLSNQAS
jgi:hypothetical protein